MNTGNSTGTNELTTSTRLASYLIILISAALLVLSLYCGWRVNGVMTGQLMSEKTLKVVCDPVVQVKIAKWGYLQFRFFLGAIVIFGLLVVFKLFSSFSKREIKSGGFWITVFVMAIIMIVLTNHFGSSYCQYNNTLNTVIKEQNRTKITTAPDQEISDTFLKELIIAVRDITKLLINWAVLLLTGLGYIIFRIMKFNE